MYRYLHEIRIYGRGVRSNLYPVQFGLQVPVPVCIAPVLCEGWMGGGGSPTLYKKVTDFPVSSRDVTFQTLPGGE